MISAKDKNKAVKLLIKYEMQYSKTCRELGYCDRKTIKVWYNTFKQNGPFVQKKIHREKTDKKIKEKIIDYYNKHGKNISNTIKHFGYPSRGTLRNWLQEKYPRRKKHCLKGKSTVQYTLEEKKVVAMATNDPDVITSDIIRATNVSRTSAYKWRNEFFDKDGQFIMKKQKDNIESLNQEIEKALLKLKEIEEKAKYAKMEYDIYLKAKEILKKDPGINLINLTKKEKAELIYTLKEEYQLKILFNVLHISKSCYYYSLKNISNDKYKTLKIRIKEIFFDNYECYGYRRIYGKLKTQGYKVSEKVIRRLTKLLNLQIKSLKKKKYSSYLGEISPSVPNLLKKDFKSNKPNQKWLTDITEFSLPSGKVYLSPIIDCFDGSVISWTIGTSPTKELANTMLLEAISTLSNDEKPIVHSDRGGHYRWPEWIAIMEDNQLVRSMSKKGCSPDNSACEGFFGRLKNEFFYNRDWRNTPTKIFINKLNDYINWYNNKRIKLSLNYLSPLAYRMKSKI